MKVYNPAAQFDFQSVANDRKLHDIGVFILIREPFTTNILPSRVRNRVLIRWWRQQNNRFSADRYLYRSGRSFRGSGLGEQR
jgi:hypothetical protein